MIAPRLPRSGQVATKVMSPDEHTKISEHETIHEQMNIPDQDVRCKGTNILEHDMGYKKWIY